MPKLGLGVQLSRSRGGNKRVAAYKATGSGLSPNIDGMLFYAIGTFNAKTLYASDDGYFLFYAGASWGINKTKTSGLGIGIFSQIPLAAEPTTKTYGGNYGYTGTVTIVKA